MEWLLKQIDQNGSQFYTAALPPEKHFRCPTEKRNERGEVETCTCTQREKMLAKKALKSEKK